MIEFKGTTENDWLSMEGHRVKAIVSQLNKYNEKKPKGACPFMGK